MGTPNENTPLCEVCERRRATEVRQCGFPVPFSAAYCDECTARRLEPLWVVETVVRLEADGTIDPLSPAGTAALERIRAFHGDERGAAVPEPDSTGPGLE